MIAVSSLSRGLDDAQAKALDPLSSIGTDLTVTLAPQTQDASQGGGLRRRRLRRCGREVIAGEPVGDHRPLEARQARRPVRPRLLPARHAAHLPADDRRADREGRRRRVGLERPRARRRAPGGDGAEDRRQDQDGRRPDPGQPADPRRRPRPSSRRCRPACRSRGSRSARASGGRASTATNGQGGLGGGSAAAVAARRRRRPERVREVPAGAAAALPRHDHDAGADAAAGRRPAADEHQELEATRSPASIRRSPISASSPRPSSPAGASSPPSKGAGKHEALLSSTYASRKGLKVGSKLNLNGTVFTVVGLVRPPLGGQTADVYISAAAAAGAREPEGLRQRPPRPRRERRLGRRRAEADRDALPAGGGREREGRRRLDQRLARRRREPLEAARDGARDPGRGRRLPPRGPPHPLVGRQARARARDAEGARLDAVARRPPGRGRVARPGGPRRPRRRRPRHRRRGSRSAPSARR